MSQERETEDVKPKLNIGINHEGTSITIKVKASTPFKKIFDATEKRFGAQPGTFKFIFEGKRVSAEDTPIGLGMEDNDVVDAHLAQV
ncbi:hypothetical protein BC629DRAFT_1255742, partial [Irpex lacteus]